MGKTSLSLRDHRLLQSHPGRSKSGSDGLFLVLAVGGVLLASLLIPRAPREAADRVSPADPEVRVFSSEFFVGR